MLRALAIRKVVIADAVDLEFGPGLNVLTGETGAGKSILLDSLGLALGARADARLARAGGETASVTAEFELDASHPIWAVLREAELPEDEGRLILRRTVAPDGRSRAFVNDHPATVAILREIGERIAEVHGQFEQHGLLDPGRHAGILDAAGGLAKEARAAASAWGAWSAAREASEASRAEAAAARREEAFLRHGVEELETLAAEPGEEAALADRRAFLMGRGRLAEALETAGDAIRESEAAAAIRKAERALARSAEAAAGAFDDALQALERAGIELDEAERALEAAEAALDADPGALERTEERLFALRDMARKHGVGPDDLPALLERMAASLDLIDRTEDRLGELDRAADAAEAAYAAAAEKLSVGRKRAAAALEAVVAKELPPLKLERAEFAVELTPLDRSAWGPRGRERVRFVARANPGLPFGPIDKIASGGELARFGLALQVVLADGGDVETLVFDEVDSGVGGATAAAVGARLKRLAATVQTLVVTHSPQVAALGVRHFRVEKAEAGGAVTSRVVALDDASRREEVARMLSGAEVTTEARAQAERLLEDA